MLTNDWILPRVLDIYRSYFHTVRVRSNEGRAHLLHASYSIFLHQGLHVERIGPSRAETYDPATGDGALIVEDYLLVDVACAPRLGDGEIRRFNGRLEAARCPKGILLNFGSRTPEFYPTGERVKDWQEEDWGDAESSWSEGVIQRTTDQGEP